MSSWPAAAARRWRSWPPPWASAARSRPATSADAAAADALVAAADPVDILVNNAGITRDMLALRLKDADWQAVLDTNLSAAFRLARAALKGMIKRRHGRIVNVTSIVGVTGNPGQANYAAAKAGLIGMSKALAQEVAARGVTVNCIAPGFIDTAMTQALDDRQREALLGRIPAGRLGAGSDIAAGVDLPRQHGGELRHRPDPACERRDGHDLKPAVRPVRGCVPSQAWGLRVKAPTLRALSVRNPEGARNSSEKPKVAERRTDE